jgi:hypothetical protein
MRADADNMNQVAVNILNGMWTCPSLRRPAGGPWAFRGCITGSKPNIVIVIAVVLSACAAEQRESLTPRAPTLKEQSLLLKIGMSEQEVTKLLGPPSKAEVGQCGENPDAMDLQDMDLWECAFLCPTGLFPGERWRIAAGLLERRLLGGPAAVRRRGC